MPVVSSLSRRLGGGIVLLLHRTAGHTLLLLRRFRQTYVRAAADCAGIPGLEEGREGRGRRRTRTRDDASTLEELASPPQINVVRVTVRQEPGFCL